MELSCTPAVQDTQAPPSALSQGPCLLSGLIRPHRAPCGPPSPLSPTVPLPGRIYLPGSSWQMPIHSSNIRPMSLPQEAFRDSLSTTPPLGSCCILTSAGLPLGCGSWLPRGPVLPPPLLLAGAWGPGARGRALGGHLQCARPSTRWRHSTSKATEGAWGPPEGEGQDGAAELCRQAAVPPGTRADPSLDLFPSYKGQVGLHSSREPLEC